MTVLEHIKHLIVGLTAKEKEDLAGFLSEPQPIRQRRASLRGDWSDAFSDACEIDCDLKEIRSQWRNEWRSGEFGK